MIFPKPLKAGDRIALLSPAGCVNPMFVTGAIQVLKGCGWEPYTSRCTLSVHGSYSGRTEERLTDLKTAFADATTRAIFCTRGGYGCVQLLEALNEIDVTTDPKWLIGFSDVSALHALMQSKGVASVHASMAKHLYETGGNDSNSQALFSILQGRDVAYEWEPHAHNHTGSASGRIVGGNLAVLQGLINTPFDLLHGNAILFIEDIAEPIYKVERMLWQLRLSGVLGRLQGLIVGRFVQYSPDRNYTDMATMIRDMVADCNIPVAFEAPVGHIDNNIPIIEGATASLMVTTSTVSLSMRQV